MKIKYGHREKTMRHILIVILSLVFAGMIFPSCVHNELVVDDYIGSSGYNPNAPKYIIYFNPRMESNFSRSVTAFPKGCIVHVYVMADAKDLQFIASPGYYSQSEGTLTPVSDPLMLPIGQYDIFATSIKSSSYPPDFSDYMATGLKNGTDYLWWGDVGYSVSSTGNVIDITFTHCASQVVFTLTNNTDKNITEITKASIGVPVITDTVKWYQMAGTFSSLTTAPTDTMSMSISDMSMSGIFIPYSSTEDIPLNATIEVNGISEDISMNFSMPDGGFLGGHSYNYEIIYAVDSVMFGNIIVAPWQGNNMGNVYPVN